MRNLVIALVASLSLALSSCGAMTALGTAVNGGGPVSVANQSKLDEQVGLTITLAYTAAARAAGLAISTGVIKDRATIARIGQLDTRAYAAVKAVRDAYVAVNSSAYLSALDQARQAVADLLAAVRGPSAQLTPPAPTYDAVVRDLASSDTHTLAAHLQLAAATGGDID